MKTLILNGSPRKNGDTVALIEAMRRHLIGDVQVLSISDNISPCIDCRFCWHKPGCSIDDKMQEVYLYMEECDNIVLASPIWFSELSGPLLNLASRLVQTYFAAGYFRKEETNIRKKNGVLILVGAEKGTEVKASSTAHTILKHMNALPCVSTVFSLDTNKIPAANDTHALKQAQEAAFLLNDLYNASATFAI